MFETFMDSILANILEIISTIITMVVAFYVVPFIKSDLIPWLKEKRLYNTVESFVRAAEKLAESGMIEKCDKKNKVVELLKNKGIEVDDTVEAFIESCVKELDIVTSTIYEEIMEADIETEILESEAE
jgi:hypothetical protein